MPLFPPQFFRKTEGTHRIGLSADKPAAADVLVGTLYFSIDTLALERSNGTTWDSYSPSGAPGATGTTGPPGIQGDQGEQGDFFPIPGPVGLTGSAGATGASGAIGPIGPTGDTGEDGFDGLPGPTGPAGTTGATGAAGPQGVAGPPGYDTEEPIEPLMIPGPRGATGAAGGTTFTDFTKDLGAADYSGTFDITGLAGLTVDKNVIIVQTMQQISSKGNARDEFEMQPIVLTGYVFDAATIRALWNCDSVCVGTYAFAYAVSS